MDTNLNNATITDLSNVSNYSVNSQVPDASSGIQKETFYDYPDSAQYLGYYKEIPELKKAIDALATWVTGKGYEISSITTKTDIDFMKGWGEDSFQAICWNLEVQKKVFGDAFAEIIRDNGRLLNIKPLYTGDMRVVVNDKGIVDHYEQRTNVKDGEPRRLEPYQVLHLVNDRVANEIHGVSVIDAVKWVIDARNEAMKDWRRISHLSSIRVIYVDADDTTKLNQLKTQYQNGIATGNVMVLPGRKGVDYEIDELTLPPIDAFLRWIQYLEGFFYQAVGIPRVIATSENYTEAASKVGYLTFEPIYTREQTELESDLLKQAGIRIIFNRPPSLMETMQNSESKNTSQTGFQPGDLNPGVKP